MAPLARNIVIRDISVTNDSNWCHPGGPGVIVSQHLGQPSIVVALSFYVEDTEDAMAIHRAAMDRELVSIVSSGDPSHYGLSNKQKQIIMDVHELGPALVAANEALLNRLDHLERENKKLRRGQ